MRVGWGRRARDQSDTSGPSAIVKGTASGRLYRQ
jgi:hypothetical protein